MRSRFLSPDDLEALYHCPIMLNIPLTISDRSIEIIQVQQKRVKGLKEMNRASGILETIPKGLIFVLLDS